MRCYLGLIVAASLTCTILAQKKARDLDDLLKAHKNLTQFAALLTTYEDLYLNLTSQHENITILAPNNEAFTKIENSQISDAFANNQSDAIRAILQYHIIPGLHPSTSYTGSFQFNPTYLDNTTYSNVTGGQVVGGVRQSGDLNIFTSGYGSRTTVIQPDLIFSGGIVHTIDTFLIPPPSLLQTLTVFNLTSFGGALEKATLLPTVSQIRDITIFAPSNDAIQLLGSTLSTLSSTSLASILNYHIVPGAHTVGYSPRLTNGTVLHTRANNASLIITFASNSLFVNSARILQQDILLTNGVLHLIDNVLSPNATAALPVPSLHTQKPVFSTHPLANNLLPFATLLPNTTTSASASATETVAGSATDYAAATSASASATAGRSTKKGVGSRVERGWWGGGVVLGTVAWVLRAS